MSNLLENNSFNEIFKREFKGVELLTEVVPLGNGNAHALFVYIKDENELSEKWIQITNTVALHYQKNLTNDFDKWNLYLFFLVTNPQELSNEIKYTIENNTFSTRKIIESNSTHLNELINDHIHNKLTVESDIETPNKLSFDYNEIIWNTLKDKTIKKINIIPEEQMKTYNELLNKLRIDI